MNRYNEHASAPLSATEQQARDEAHDAQAAPPSARSAPPNRPDRPTSTTARRARRPSYRRRRPLDSRYRARNATPSSATPAATTRASVATRTAPASSPPRPPPTPTRPSRAPATRRPPGAPPFARSGRRRRPTLGLAGKAPRQADVGPPPPPRPAPTPAKDGLTPLDRAIEALVREHTSGSVIDAAWAAARRIFQPVSRLKRERRALDRAAEQIAADAAAVRHVSTPSCRAKQARRNHEIAGAIRDRRTAHQQLRARMAEIAAELART